MGYTREQLSRAADVSELGRMKLAIRDCNAHGSYFFSKATMEFWGSKIESGLFKNDTFVTSEDNYNRTERLYTARFYDWKNHSVKTIGGFQQFDNKENAIKFAKSY